MPLKTGKLLPLLCGSEMPKVMHNSEVNGCGSNEGQLIASLHRSDTPFKQQKTAIVCLDSGLHLPSIRQLIFARATRVDRL